MSSVHKNIHSEVILPHSSVVCQWHMPEMALSWTSLGKDQ